MNRVIKFLPLIFSGLLGADWTLTGIRYIGFYSGGSGFVVPIPAVVWVLFVSGLAIVAATILSIWFPRFAAVSCIAVLLVMTITTILQTITHDRPSEVLLKRGTFVVLYIAVSVMLYWFWLRKKVVQDA